MLQSVSAVEPGDKRQYEYFSKFDYSDSQIFNESYSNIVTEDSSNSTVEFMVEFQRFAYSRAFDIRPPRFYVEGEPKNRVFIPEVQILNYSGQFDRVCPAVDQNLYFLYYIGQTIDVGSCIRKNMYYSALTPILTPETFPQNSSIVEQIFTQDSSSIDIEQPLTVRSVAASLGYDLPIDEYLYTYRAKIRLLSANGQIGYSVSSKLEVDNTELISELTVYHKREEVYGEWDKTEQVLYDVRTGWIVSYQQNISFSKLSPDLSSIIQVDVNLSRSLTDISPPFLNGIIPDEFMEVAAVLLLLVVLYMVWRWRRRKRGSGGQKEDLYPEQ